MKSVFVKASLFLLIAVCFVSTLKAQDEQAQKSWQEYMTPGSQHEMLSKMAGEWVAKAKMWMAPGAEPTEFEGKAHYEMILGGRYLSSKYEATMMGMPFTGMQMDAYDNAKKEFVSVWIDNMGTGVLLLKGQYDEKTKAITYTGSTYDPASGKDADMKVVITFIDENTHRFEMYMVNGDQEFKSMEMLYTRI